MPNGRGPFRAEPENERRTPNGRRSHVWPAPRLAPGSDAEAADNIDDVALAGLRQDAKTMSKEGAQRAKKELAVLAAGPAELMARLGHFVVQGEASQRILRYAESLLEGLGDHFAPSDRSRNDTRSRP